MGKRTGTKIAKTANQVVIRAVNAGLFYGTLVALTSVDGTMVAEMEDVRRIWYWCGAATLSQLAEEGVKVPASCKFSMKVQHQLVIDVIEVLDLTAEGKKSLDSVPDWKK